MPVAYNPKVGVFEVCSTLEAAVRKSPIAVEGFYLILKNPASKEGEDHPPRGGAGKIAPELQVGRKITIPGPCMFSLWPGQDAQVLRGHHLRSNQYLLVRVYNEEEAKVNWSKSVIKYTEKIESTVAETPSDLTVGRQFVIKGTEVSFYIPPTGVSVVPEAGKKGPGDYVREALTLERLEYCILVDEDGRKRYERGPQVVFPEPTEAFVSRDNKIKFRAIELNEIQGLHIKVIAPYEEAGTTYKEGDELFVTGKQTAIYFPREEHSLISYDGKSKHFATAIPAGEGRYVMDRLNGEIAMTVGPAMLLPDPRSKVIVRRALSEKEAALWYPGNADVIIYNSQLRQVAESSPTTRHGVVSEGDFERAKGSSTMGFRDDLQASASPGRKEFQYSSVANYSAMEKSLSNKDQKLIADEFSRSSGYTAPRTVVLNTKFQGVPSIDVWNGYAVMVTTKSGHRKVVLGPATVLLQYDETLEVLSLSKGCPKSSEKQTQTVFLKVIGNGVSDGVVIETSDHVKVSIYLKYKVNFEGDSSKWWMENYVQYLADHARSVLQGALRQLKVEEFYGKSTEIVRNVILGPSTPDGRPGMLFPENGMRVTDVEVLEVKITDDKIRTTLDQSQHDVIKNTLEIQAAERQLERIKALKEIERQNVQISVAVDISKAELTRSVEKRKEELALELTAARKIQIGAEHDNTLAAAENTAVLQRLNLVRKHEEHAFEKGKLSDQREHDLAMLEAITKSTVEQATAISPHLVSAIQRLADETFLGGAIKGFGELAAIKGAGILKTAQEFFDLLPENSNVHLLQNIGQPAKKSK
jgi:major vault protein